MSTVKDQARVSVRGRDLADDSVEYRGWLVYTAAREKAEKQGNQPLFNAELQLPGVQFKGSLQGIVNDLFPEANHLSGEERVAFQRPIYGFLSGSHNAVCVHKGGGTGVPIWWLAPEWNDAHAQHAPGPKGPEDRVKVTPQELGAGLPTPPVETSYGCKACKARFDSPLELGRHVGSQHKESKPCPECGRPFKNLGAHRRKAHGISKDGTKVYPCKICHRTLGSPQAYAGHMKAHQDRPEIIEKVVVVNQEAAAPSVSGLAATIAAALQEEIEKATAVLAQRAQAAEARAAEAEAKLAKLREALS